MSRGHGKGKSEVSPTGSRTRPRRVIYIVFRSWELAGNWGATESVSVVSWADLSEGGMRWGVTGWVLVGASTSHIQKDLGCGLNQKEESLENF